MVSDLIKFVEFTGTKILLKGCFLMSLSDLEEISQALQQNASDFIEKGLSYIIEDEKKDYKYSLLHIFSGTVLFLKDVLYKEHWSFIFQDIDKAKKDDLLENRIKSVDFSTLLFRLNNLTNAPMENKLVEDLGWMQKERNKIEHFHNELNHFEVRSRIASLLGNLIDFIKKIHKSDENYDMTGFSEHDYQALFETLQEYSLRFQEYITKRNQVIQSRLEICEMIIKCPSCNQKALEIDSENNKTTCHFCLEELTFDMFFAKYSPIYFDVESYDIIDGNGSCLSCRSFFLYDDDGTLICFKCLETYDFELSECVRCGISQATEGLCDSCLEHVMGQ